MAEIVFSLLYKINETSRAIVKKSEEFIVYLNHYTDEVSQRNKVKKDVAISAVNTVLGNWLEIASAVISDSPKLYEETDTTAGFNFEHSDLFSEVWGGDAYNKSGVDGLKALLKDLEDTLSKMTRKNLLEQSKKVAVSTS